MASSNAAGSSGAKESSLTTLISRLEEKNIPYFYKVMSKTAVTPLVWGAWAYALSFPVSFVRAQAANFGELATFQLSNCDQAWPIELTNTDPDPSGESLKIFAFGPGGWKDFVVANGIQVRDTLVFALVAQSLFRVHILKADSAEDHEEEDPSRDPSSFPLPCKRCRNVPSQNSGPRFVVNVTRSTQVNKLDVPGAFWLCFRDMLPSRVLKLKGPSGVVMLVNVVKGTFYEKEQELHVHLNSGWKEFFVANDLRIGDLLEFSLVGPGCFLVDVHRL